MEQRLQNVHCTILHYSPLVKRREYLLGIGGILQHATWITEKHVDPELWNKLNHRNCIAGMTELEIGAFFRTNTMHLKMPRFLARTICQIMLKVSPFNKRIQASLFGSKPKFEKLEYKFLEFSLMHVRGLEVFQAEGKDWYLCFEDDAVLEPEFEDRLQQTIEAFDPSDSCLISIGTGSGLSRKKLDAKSEKNGLYKVTPSSCRGLAATLISRGAVNSLLGLIQTEGIPDWLPIDFTLSLYADIAAIETYWMDPPLVLQGSQSGHYMSNLR